MSEHERDPLRDRAFDLFIDGDFEAAAVALRGVLARSSTDIDARRALALSLIEAGVRAYDARRWSSAVASFSEAALVDPSSARAAFSLGLALEAQREPAAALAAYRDATQRDPTHIDAGLALADTLAGLGELPAAIEAIDRALAHAPRGADPALLRRAARNREVLARALVTARGSRLLGAPIRDLEASAVLALGGLARRPSSSTVTARYSAPLVEIEASLDDAARVTAALLVLTDPGRLSRAADDRFRVTVVREDGSKASADFATGVTLTFLREMLGCSTTRAAELYARLIDGELCVRADGAVIAFETTPSPSGAHPPRHGLRVRVDPAPPTGEDTP